MNVSFGQRFQQFKPTQISVKSKGGFLIAHRANMSHLPYKNTHAFEIDFSQQDVSNNQWAEVYKNPLRGLSFQYQDFGNREMLGQSFSLFAHTTFPLIQRAKFGFLDFRICTGAGYLTKPYDAETNPKNTAIGSHFNGFVNLSFQWHKYFKFWHVGAGIELGHFSNSAMKVPNLGLNLPSVSFNVGYNLVERSLYTANRRQNDDITYRTKMADELRIFGIGSAKQNLVQFNPPKSRPVIALSAMYSLRLGERWKLEFALDGIFNGGNQWHLDSSAYSVGQTLQMGVYIGGAIHFYKAEFHTGIGVYAISQVHPYGRFYNRLGFKYHFTDHISGLIGIKSHFAVADYLEIGVGYTIGRWRE